MRIQHNIMAMSAYRNYTNNVSAMKKNLERLSSGYKINRAGDDAAGLAISEKMRAQITGLETAQKNAKDGISLVQTAEGALTEVHDMLNRMVELASMSANGTYEDTTDRAQLQKEMDQLKLEINRIADSANFNGIQLLDGSMDVNGAAAILAAAQSSYDTTLADAQAAYEKAIADAQAAYENAIANVKSSKTMDITGEDGIMLEDSESNDPFNTTNGVGLGTIYQVKADNSTSKPGFHVNMENITFTFDDPTSNTSGLTLTINGTTITIHQDDLAQAMENAGIVDSASDVKAGTKLTSAQLASALAEYIGNSAGTNGVWTDDDGNSFKVSADNGILKFELQGKTDANFNADFKMSSNVKVQDIEETTNSYTTSSIAVSGTAANWKDLGTSAATISFTVSYTNSAGVAASASISITLSELVDDWDTGSGAAISMDAILDKLVDKINNHATLKELFTAEKGAGDTIKLTSKISGDSKQAVTKIEVSSNFKTSTADADVTKVTGHAGGTAGMDGYSNAGNQNIVEATKGVNGQLFSTSLAVSQGIESIEDLDGAKFTLGNTTYTINLTKDKNGKITGGSILGGNDGAVSFKLSGAEDDFDSDLKTILSALSHAAKDNATFTVGVDEAGRLTLKQRNAADSMTDREEFGKYIKISLVNPEDLATTKAAATSALTEATTNADTTLKSTTKAAEDALKAAQDAAKKASPLVLQIGDTSDSWNQLEVSIKACKTGNIGEMDDDGNVIEGRTLDNIKISDQKSAQDAIDVIKGAINYISDVRGTLGATQNRLDHTINNLSVMTENIQDAESTIRDTDIAEEMMAYTKNNILIQSAQAMLAQANQVPQGVLQLLQ